MLDFCVWCRSMLHHAGPGLNVLPRDAMLARYVLWPCVRLCLSVCLSVTSRCSNYYTLVDCNSNPITSICSGLVVQVVPTLLCSSWQDFDWHITSRGLSVVAELLVNLFNVLTTTAPRGAWSATLCWMPPATVCGMLHKWHARLRSLIKVRQHCLN